MRGLLFKNLIITPDIENPIFTTCDSKTLHISHTEEIHFKFHQIIHITVLGMFILRLIFTKPFDCLIHLLQTSGILNSHSRELKCLTIVFPSWHVLKTTGYEGIYWIRHETKIPNFEWNWVDEVDCPKNEIELGVDQEYHYCVILCLADTTDMPWIMCKLQV